MNGMATQKKQEAPLLPVYLIVGEDALKRDTVMKRLRARLSSMGDLSFNADEFDGETAQDTLDRLEAAGARVFRTDEQGDVSCKLTADRIEVDTLR